MTNRYDKHWIIDVALDKPDNDRGYDIVKTIKFNNFREARLEFECMKDNDQDSHQKIHIFLARKMLMLNGQYGCETLDCAYGRPTCLNN